MTAEARAKEEEIVRSAADTSGKSGKALDMLVQGRLAKWEKVRFLFFSFAV